MSPYARAVTLSRGQSAEQLVAFCGGIIKGLTNNPAYPNPPVDLKTLQAAVDDLNAALAAQPHGGMAATAEKKNKQEALVSIMCKLKHYVKDNCGKSGTHHWCFPDFKPLALGLRFAESFQDFVWCNRRSNPFSYSVCDSTYREQRRGHAMADAGSAITGISASGFDCVGFNRAEIHDCRFLILEHIRAEFHPCRFVVDPLFR